MINAVGREIPEEVLKATGKEPFKGVYAYTGEFFFKAFRDCGDSGTYRTAKKITGVGFSPYIYHGLQYNFTDYFGVETGIIVPAIFVMSVQWSFR